MKWLSNGMSGNVTPLDGPVWKVLIALDVPEFMKMLMLDWGIRFSATLKKYFIPQCNKIKRSASKV